MILNKPYNKELFYSFLKDFLPDFKKDERKVRVSEKSILTEVFQLGKSKDVNVTILEAICEEKDSSKRIAITQAAFKVLRDHSIRNAIIAFHDGGNQWRLSLLTSTLDIINGSVLTKDSNPRRYSYLLGLEAKTVTPFKYLIEQGPVFNVNQLKERFSVEVVNKDFYASIAELFTKLIGGNRGETKYHGLLEIKGSVSQKIEHQEFAVRLIGRVIFSWFLKEKKSKGGVPIVPNDLLSLSAVTNNLDYYHSILEPLFFELLNKRVLLRHENLRKLPFSIVPYLNGGLFSPQHNDFYNQNSYSGAGSPGQTHIPNSWFTELFTILEQYNFTVDENTSYDVDLSIDPEMLGRIFENLLAEINPETGESARKNTGSFYTPREIVDYMVDSSLLEFLKTKTKINQDKLKALITWGQEDDEKNSLLENEKEKVVSALANLTILDPACGSGAFPISILQKVVYVLQQVDKNANLWLQNQLRTITSPELRHDIQNKFRNENYDYLRKLGVIRESIFGVDIQTIATEISKLRCFLTLVIEEDIDDSAENRGIRPLPNLEFKFITANSLIGLPESGHNLKSKDLSTNLFDEKSHIDRLKEIRSHFFIADTEERTRLRDEFKDLQLEMVRRARDFEGVTSKLYNELSDWNPFNHDKTDWFDSEWMFGNQNFDIVIANPPYVGEKGNKSLFEELKTSSLGKRFYKGKMDLFYFFFHLGLDNLKEGGILTFITTNYYPTADGAIKLRKDLYYRSNIVRLINFGDITVFDSARGQHNLITVLERANVPESDYETESIVSNTKGKVSSGALTSMLTGVSELVTLSRAKKQKVYNKIEDKFYIRFAGENNGIDRVLERVAYSGSKLNNWSNINTGLYTAADKIFIFKDESDVTSKIKNINPLEQSLFKPFYKNSDIRQYFTSLTSTKKILYHYEDSNYSISEIPNVYKYLMTHKDKLTARRDNSLKGALKRGRWDVMSLAKKAIDFNGPKIVAPQRSSKNTFAYNEKPWFASADVYFVTAKEGVEFLPFYLLGILNSHLIYTWLYHRGKRKGQMLELYGTPLSEIPIAISKPDQREIIEKYVKEIISAKSFNPHAETTNQESEIDKIVYELYNLTPEEISIIEKSKNT